MILASINFDEEQRTLVVIVIEKDNLERMKQADPITLESNKRGGLLTNQVKYPADLSMLIAYEEDDVELYRLAKSANIIELVKYLERGRKWNPEIDGKDKAFHLQRK